MPDSTQKYGELKIPASMAGLPSDVLENESCHRDREWAKLNADITARRRAQWWGGTICLVALGGAIATALAGVHPAVSIALAGIPIVVSIRAVIAVPR